jgi:hypothetical protein
MMQTRSLPAFLGLYLLVPLSLVVMPAPVAQGNVRVAMDLIVNPYLDFDRGAGDGNRTHTRRLFKAYEMRRLVKPGQPRAIGVRIVALCATT